MPLSIPTRKGVSDNLRASVRTELPELDPSTERRSFIGGLIKSLASLMYDFYIALKRYAEREPFPQTATGTFLTRGWWVPITKLQPLAAAPAHGYLAVEATAGTVIPLGTTFQSAGVTFRSMAAITATLQSMSGTITPDADKGVAVFATPSPHNLATDMTVLISGASPADYNGSYAITVTGAQTFEYEPSVLPGSAATGAPLTAATFALVEVEATTTGQETNVDSGSDLAITNTIPGSESLGLVTWGGLTGGTDAETEDSFRARVLEALGTDYGMFTKDEIEIVAKTVPGVTRVMVRRATIGATNGVAEGQVKIGFLRDNDAGSPLPSAQEVDDVKDQILSLILPAHTAPEDVIVMSPPPMAVDFEFSAIYPDTPGMRRSIEANLKQFFREAIEWGEDVTEDDYRCAILNAYDTETRQRLRSFSLDSPTGPITPSGDDYPVLGDVTYG